MNWYKVKLAVYDTNLYVGFVSSYDELYRLGLKDGADLTKEDKETDIEGLFYYNKDDYKRILLVVPTSNRVIVHETFHATMHILHDIGHEFDINNHETHAWLQDYLFEEVSKIRDLQIKAELKKTEIKEGNDINPK